MGRRLNALEEAQAALADHERDQHERRARLRQQLLGRIADTLGIPVAELSGPPAPSSAAHPTVGPARQDAFALTQQCADLVRTFLQIQDPQDRLRCLEIVRDAAGMKSPGSAS